MDINELLCVGRTRNSQVRIDNSLNSNSNRTLRRVGLYPEENSIDITDIGTSSKFTTSETDMFTSGYMTPPKKSILRGGKPVSPRYGSPTSIYRSVRFSEKGHEDESVFSRLHLNETTQTDHGNVNKPAHHHQRSKPIICGKSKFEEDLDLSDTQHVKTSTPRYNKPGETPSPDFLLPQRFDEKPARMLSTSPKASEQKHHKEKMVIDIDITPKHSARQPTTQDNTKASKGTKTDGYKIIQNMSLNESSRPINVSYVPSASKITQNMDLSHLNFISSGTQTMSEASSPRSASPEVPYSVPPKIPDGNSIIRNLELNAQDSRIRMKSESVQTIDMEPEPISKTIGIQTEPEDESTGDVVAEPENERYRSISLQANLDMSDASSEGDAASRSIATQTQDQKPVIPDGASITKNMVLHKNPHEKEEQPRNKEVKETMVKTNAKLQHSSLNDKNWNEFVRHLEMFNPSPCSSDSESDDEIDELPASLKREPVIVYDSHEHAATSTADRKTSRLETQSTSVIPHRESKGAKKLLESEEFTRQQYESVLREGGLLQKLKSSYKPPRSETVVQKEKQNTSIDHPVKRTKASPASTTQKRSVSPIASSTRTYKQVSESGRPNSSIQTYIYRDDNIDSGNELSVQVFDHTERRASKDSLTFTPIETYSFNPDTLTKTNTTIHSIPSETPTSYEQKPVINEESVVKESVSKNAYIRGVDLGPIPPAKPSTRPTPRSASPKRYMQPTLSSQAASRSYCFSTSRKDSSNSYRLGPSNSTSKYQSRPSSAPGLRSRGHPLSSSLREMRNTAARKSAMNSLLDPKRKSSYDYGSSKYSYNSRQSTSPYRSSFSQRQGSSYKSYEDYDRFTYSGSNTSFLNKSYTASNYGRTYSSNPSPKEYMNALQDVSNARLERSRSRSRSPNCDLSRSRYIAPTTTTSQYTQPKSRSSFDTDKEVEMLVHKSETDEGFVESVSCFRAHPTRNSTERVGSRDSSKERQSRCVYRKPPLPTKSKTPRSRDSSKERVRSSSRSPSYDRSNGQTNGSRSRPSPIVKEKMNPVSKERNSSLTTRDRSPNGNKKGRSSKGDTDANDGTITIGSIPSSVIDKACMFLGHEVIQKIINEAKL